MANVLTYGPFSCTDEHAVKMAYLINIAEYAIDKNLSAHSEIGYILADYCAGSMTFEDCVKAIEADE